MGSQKVFVVGTVTQGDGLLDVVRDLIRLSATSKIYGCKIVTSCDLAWHEEIILPILPRALSNSIAKLSLGFDSYLCGLVKPEPVNV
jgi:hypothetical protein